MAEKIEIPVASGANSKATDSECAFEAWRESLADASEELKGFAEQMAQLIQVMRATQDMASAYMNNPLAKASLAYGQTLRTFGHGAPHEQTPGYRPNVLYQAAASMDPRNNELVRVTQELQRINASLEGLTALLPARLNQIDQNVIALQKTWMDYVTGFISTAGGVIAITQVLRSPTTMMFAQQMLQRIGGAAAGAEAGVLAEGAEAGLIAGAGAEAGLAMGAGSLLAAALAPEVMIPVLLAGLIGQGIVTLWENMNAAPQPHRSVMDGWKNPDPLALTEAESREYAGREALRDLVNIGRDPERSAGARIMANERRASLAELLAPPEMFTAPAMRNLIAMHETSQRMAEILAPSRDMEGFLAAQRSVAPFATLQSAAHVQANPFFEAICGSSRTPQTTATDQFPPGRAPFAPQVLEPIQPLAAARGQGPPQSITMNIHYQPSITVTAQAGETLDAQIMRALRNHAYELGRIIEDEQRRKARSVFD